MSLRELTGYIRSDDDGFQSNQDEADTENEELEDIEPEFLDMNEVNCVSFGGNMFKTSMPALKEVLLMAGNRTYRVKGHFHLCDPWWKVTCRVNGGGRRFFTLPSSYPSYSLRTNLRSEGRSLVSLFLKECEADPLFVNMFMEWLPSDTDVELVNVLDVLQDFEDSAPEHKAVAEQLKSNVINSVAWTRVRVASMHPQIMKYLPTLLPFQFMDIISNGKMKNTQDTAEETPQQQSNTDLLENLEKLIENDVWKFGFNYIMFKEFRMIRCEAKIKSFELCNLLRRIPEVPHNALRLYAELKDYCRETGSTYIEQKKLLEKMQQWKIAFEGALFLNEQGVLIQENNKVALHNFFSYEKDIAECLRALVEGDPWKINLDVRKVLQRAQMERLRGKACDARTSTSEQNDMEQGAGCKQKDEAQPGSSSMDHNGGMATDCDSPQSFEVSEPTIKEEDSDSDSNDSTYSDIDLSSIELDEDQVRAAEMMCANPMTIISGKGGCGKTTVVSLVFKAAMQKQTSKSDSDEKPPVEVLLSAPTGRAASLLTKRTGFTAYTMHQVLWSFMNAKKDQNGNLQEWKFSKVRVLVVDEGSLVSVQILHSILSMLTKHAELQKFIILGDVRQLPSIEPGNTLCDLFEGLQKVRWAIEMRTNHRAESELIVRNAGLISEMGTMFYRPLEFDAIIKMTKPSTVPSDKMFIFVQISEKSDALQEAIHFLLDKAPGLKDHKSSQIVAFMRKDCQDINDLCCNHYSHHSTMTPEKKICFQKGDKVCCTKNGYISDKDDENMQEESAHDVAGSSQDIQSTQRRNEEMREKRERMCNGEIFFIKADVTEVEMGARHKTRRYLTLDDENGRVVTSNYSELQRECKLRHAWARTIHTFQGSEAETIVYVLGSRGENWQHVYTAVTRGQKRVYVVGRECDLKRAIEKKITPRNTRLRGRVKEIVAQQGPQDFFTQSGCRQSHVNHGPPQSTPVAAKRHAQSDPCTTQSKLTKQTTSEEPLSDSASSSPKSHSDELP